MLALHPFLRRRWPWLRGTSLKEQDKDNDKNISKQEAQADQDLSADFSQWDADNDSVLSQQEFEAYQKAERSQRAGQQGQQQQQQSGAGSHSGGGGGR